LVSSSRSASRTPRAETIKSTEEPAAPELALAQRLEALGEACCRTVAARKITQIDGKRNGLIVAACVHELLELRPGAIDVAT